VESSAANVETARLDVLLEALEIFIHDLSNPLQSLIVLTELALDDAPADSEDEQRCRQTLEAADRMRNLVIGLAGYIRGNEGPRSARHSVDRFVHILSRRWERHRVELQIELGPVEQRPTPPLLDLALLNLGLAAVSTASDLAGSFLLTIRGQAVDPDGPEQRCALEFSLAHRDPDGKSSPVAVSAAHLDRCDILLVGSTVRVRRAEDRVWLEFVPGVAQPDGARGR